MNKNMRTWVIGICVALIIIVAVAAAFANNRSGSDNGQKRAPGNRHPQIPAMPPATADITGI